MVAFILKRIGWMVFVLFAVSVISFALFYLLPGDPAVLMAGKKATPAMIDAARRQERLDRPTHEQYAFLMKRLLLGYWMTKDDPARLRTYSDPRLDVLEEIGRRAPVTLVVVAAAAVLWVVLSLGMGVLAALNAGRWVDYLISALSLAGIAVPVYWLAMLAGTGFGSDWLRNSVGIRFRSVDECWGLAIAASVLAVQMVAFYARTLRSNLLSTMGEDHVEMARARGLSPRRIFVRHVLRNSLLPMVTLFGMDFGVLIAGGAILTETALDIKGLGQFMVQSINLGDAPAVVALTVYAAFLVVLLSTIADLAYPILDPRIRHAGNQS
jgi:peptide/nickel transport system permease protein